MGKHQRPHVLEGDFIPTPGSVRQQMSDETLTVLGWLESDPETWGNVLNRYESGSVPDAWPPSPACALKVGISRIVAETDWQSLARYFDLRDRDT